MVISYQGGEFIKIQLGDTVLAFNPISKDSKLKPSKFGADIAFITTNHPDFNGVDQVTYGEKKPFILNGPGEYEVSGIFIQGFLTSSNHGGNPLVNTIYKVGLEGMNICFLGALSDTEVKSNVTEALGDIDILFCPIGGEGVLDPAKAYKLAVALEPKIIVPMHYGDVGIKDALKIFMKESGENVAPVDKLTIKKKDLEGKEGDVLVLQALN